MTANTNMRSKHSLQKIAVRLFLLLTAMQKKKVSTKSIITITIGIRARTKGFNKKNISKLGITQAAEVSRLCKHTRYLYISGCQAFNATCAHASEI